MSFNKGDKVIVLFPLDQELEGVVREVLPEYCQLSKETRYLVRGTNFETIVSERIMEILESA